MLKNAYLGATIGFDTAANELSNVGCAANLGVRDPLEDRAAQRRGRLRELAGGHRAHAPALKRSVS